MSVPTYPQATNRPLGRGTIQNYKINSGKENISKENLGKGVFYGTVSALTSNSFTPSMMTQAFYKK